MQADRIFKVKLFIGITAVVIFIGGIAVKMTFPKEVGPVLSDINVLMTLSLAVFGGLVRDVLGFNVLSMMSPSEPKVTEQKEVK